MKYNITTQLLLWNNRETASERLSLQSFPRLQDDNIIYPCIWFDLFVCLLSEASKRIGWWGQVKLLMARQSTLSTRRGLLLITSITDCLVQNRSFTVYRYIAEVLLSAAWNNKQIRNYFVLIYIIEQIFLWHFRFWRRRLTCTATAFTWATTTESRDHLQ